MRRPSLAAAFLVGSLLTYGLSLNPPEALAHAQLTGSEPHSGQLLTKVPRAIEFEFGEDVEAKFGAINLYDPDGSKVEVGPVAHPQGRSNWISTEVRGTGKPGAWTAVYRVVSADGHPVSGGVVFNVGHRGTAARSVAQLSSSTSTPKSVDIGMGLARALSFVAIALGLGTVLFFVLVLRPTGIPFREETSRLLSRLTRVAAAVGALASVIGVWAQTSIASNESLTQSLDPESLSSTLSTRFGLVAALALAAWILVALSAAKAIREEKVWAVSLLSVALAFLAAVPALGGHAATQEPIGIFAPLNVVHVIAVSFWAGGVVVLFGMTRSQQGSTRASEESTRQVFLRFSALAAWAVAIVILTGVGESLINLSSVRQLTSTPYGRAILVKILLSCMLVAGGAWQRKRGIRLLKRTTAGGWVPVRRALGLETAVFIAVFGVTAALASYAPSSAESTRGPVSRSAVVGPMQVQMTVDPAAIGVNQIHLYLLNAKTGVQITSANEVTVSEKLADKSIGPLVQKAVSAGPGHWIVSAASFPAVGEWTLNVTVRVGEFDQFETRFIVPVS